jgi:hypothetical protein
MQASCREKGKHKTKESAGVRIRCVRKNKEKESVLSEHFELYSEKQAEEINRLF